MGLFTTIQSRAVAFLDGSLPPKEGQEPIAWFAAAPAIPVQAQVKKSFLQALNDAQQGASPLSISVGTVVGDNSQNQVMRNLAGERVFRFGKIHLVISCIEHPDLDTGNTTAYDVAEAVIFYFSGCQPCAGFPLILSGTAEMPDPKLRVMNVIYTMEGNLLEPAPRV